MARQPKASAARSRISRFTHVHRNRDRKVDISGMAGVSVVARPSGRGQKLALTELGLERLRKELSR